MSRPYRRKWDISFKALALALMVAFLWHLLLLWPSKEPPAVAQVRVANQEETYMLLDPKVKIIQEPATQWSDPTVYLLPSDLGFSATLRKMPVAARLSISNSWPEGISLPFEPYEWGSEANIEAIALSSSEESHVEEARAIATSPAFEASTWRITGPISQRVAREAGPLPVISSDEILAPTFISVGINGRGEVQFVILKRSSGMEKADEAAMGFARSISFIALDSVVENTLSWGILKVHWRTGKLTASKRVEKSTEHD